MGRFEQQLRLLRIENIWWCLCTSCHFRQRPHTQNTTWPTAFIPKRDIWCCHGHHLHSHQCHQQCHQQCHIKKWQVQVVRRSLRFVRLHRVWHLQSGVLKSSKTHQPRLLLLPESDSECFRKEGQTTRIWKHISFLCFQPPVISNIPHEVPNLTFAHGNPLPHKRAHGSCSEAQSCPAEKRIGSYWTIPHYFLWDVKSLNNPSSSSSSSSSS